MAFLKRIFKVSLVETKPALALQSPAARPGGPRTRDWRAQEHDNKHSPKTANIGHSEQNDRCIRCLDASKGYTGHYRSAGSRSDRFRKLSRNRFCALMGRSR